jgi:hypothetical protein
VCRLVDFISLRSGQLSGAGGSSSVSSFVFGSGKCKRFVASVRGSVLCFLWFFSELGRFLFFWFGLLFVKFWEVEAILQQVVWSVDLSWGIMILSLLWVFF